MCQNCIQTNKVSGLSIYARLAKLDPTQTGPISNAFAREVNKRFNELTKLVTQAIVQQDVFGYGIQTYGQAPSPNAFAFPRTSDKVSAFMTWFNQQADAGILKTTTIQQLGTGVEQAWTNVYIEDSYKRGIIRARSELNGHSQQVPTIEQSGGIQAVFGTPVHIDRAGLLFSRAYEELKGVTSQMGMQVSKVLSQGMIDGDGPRLLARKLVSTINGSGMGDLGITDTLGRFIPAKRRAEMIARTEVIRAHHVATIQEYRNYGLAGIRVQAEWSTAGFKVCPKCEELQGRIFTLDEIEGMIPAHPNCRCIALPYMDPNVPTQPTNPTQTPTGTGVTTTLPQGPTPVRKQRRSNTVAKVTKKAVRATRTGEATTVTEAAPWAGDDVAMNLIPEAREEYWLYKQQYLDELARMGHTADDLGSFLSVDGSFTDYDIVRKLQVISERDYPNIHTALGGWQDSTFCDGGMRLKYTASKYELNAAKETFIPSHWTLDAIEQMKNIELYSQTEYLKCRAFGQAYMDTAVLVERNAQGDFLLMRGIDGESGYALKTRILEARNSMSDEVWKMTMQSNPVTGYTSSKKIASSFGGELAWELPFSQKQILLPRQLVSGITGSHYGEAEYLVIENKTVIRSKNILRINLLK